MAGRDGLIDLTKTEVARAKTHTQNIEVAAKYPDGASEATVDACARAAHEAIDAAAKHAKTIVRINKDGE